jgi:uncharacterized protein YjbI with pentapeptide repeats
MRRTHSTSAKARVVARSTIGTIEICPVSFWRGVYVPGSMSRGVKLASAFFLLCGLKSIIALSADLSAHDITVALFHSDRSVPVDLSDKDLTYLDLAGLDFKAARLSRSDFSGDDLTEANLSGTDLSDARLDRATIIRTDFSGANLSRATLLSPTAFSGLENNWKDAPNFTGANLSGVRIAARLDGASFKGANLTEAIIGPQTAIWGSYKPRAILNGCNFTDATLVRADLSNTMLQFAKFAMADLRGANLSKSDLSKADLSGADLTGADLTDADFDGAKLDGAKGLESAVGLSTAQHLKPVAAYELQNAPTHPPNRR